MSANAKGWWSRVGWFVLLWAFGVACVAVVGYGIRLVLLG